MFVMYAMCEQTCTDRW